jgi:hypothetical protein
LAGLAPLQIRAERETPVPTAGIGKRIRHLSYSDQGGRPDGVQVMVNRRHVYVGHMFSDGVTILDATDPRRLKPVGLFTAGVNTRTHHLQVADDLMLLANGANIIAMQSYDNLRATISRVRVRCARSRSSRFLASASTGCHGWADAMRICPRISTASPTTSSASWI